MQDIDVKEELIKLLEGDMSYFEPFYEKTKQSVFYNILAILKDYALSEDALQETYVKFLENLHKLKKDQNILGYLYTISRNISLDIIRKRKREVSIETYERTLKDENSENPRSDILEIAKRILNDKEFEIVILHLVNDMTHKEIAKLKHRPLGTILWSYNNAIKKLRKEVKVNE